MFLKQNSRPSATVVFFGFYNPHFERFHQFIRRKFFRFLSCRSYTFEEPQTSPANFIKETF